MTLLEYLLQSHAVEREVKLANQAREMAAQILKENAESQGTRYPTVDSMWRELLRRAEALEKDAETKNT